MHRLDQPVEGLMVFAKNQKAAAGLSKQIQSHMIGKHYYAVSAGVPEEQEGLLEDYLVTDKKTNYTSVVEGQTSLMREGARQREVSVEKERNIKRENIKKAILEYKVLSQNDQGTLFDILLHTGRQHQIRVQMAHMGCPLVGDEKYGDAVSGERIIGGGFTEGNERSHKMEDNLCKNKKKVLMLCSYRLEFAHPITGKKMDYSIQPDWACSV